MEKYRITFDSIEEARAAFCNKMCGGECVNTCPMQEHLKATGKACAEFVKSNPFIASLTMNADIVHIKDSATDSNSSRAAVKPRLAKILGVEVGEKFKIQENGGLSTFEVTADGYFKTDPPNQVGSTYLLLDAINRPEIIIHQPSLTPGELAICKTIGANWVSREGDPDKALPIFLWDEKPTNVNGKYATGVGSLARVSVQFFPSLKPGDCINVEELMK